MFVATCRSAKLGILPLISETHTSHVFSIPVLSLQCLLRCPACLENKLVIYIYNYAADERDGSKDRFEDDPQNPSLCSGLCKRALMKRR